MAQLSNRRCTNLWLIFRVKREALVFKGPLEMLYVHVYVSLFFLRDDVLLSFVFQVSDDGRYAVLSITEGCEPVNQLWYCDLQQLPDGITGLY